MDTPDMQVASEPVMEQSNSLDSGTCSNGSSVIRKKIAAPPSLPTLHVKDSALGLFRSRGSRDSRETTGSIFSPSTNRNRSGLEDDEGINVRANVQPSIAERDAQLRNTGDRLTSLGLPLFAVSFVYGTLVNWAFYAGEVVLINNDQRGACVALAATSFSLNFITLVSIKLAVLVMRRDLRIKSRGSDFLIGTAIFSTLTYWLAFFMILQFLGYLGPIQLWELSLPPDDTATSEEVSQWIWLCMLMSLAMIFLNAYIACIIGRMRLMYYLLGRPSETVLTARRLRWIFWQVVLVMTVLNFVLAFLPVCLYLVLYEPSQAEAKTTLGWVVVFPVLMMLIRLGVTIFYMWRTHGISMSLFYDRHQSLRLVVLDGMVYIAFYVLLCTEGYNSVTFLYLFHMCMFHTTVYQLDVFLPIIYDVHKHGITT